MNKVTRFEDLDCWKAARVLVKDLYHFTQDGPISRDWRLRDQLRSAAVSIMNNIAEGFGRKSDREFVRFLGIASASGHEVRSMLYVLEDIGYLKSENLKYFHGQTQMTINLTLGMIRYLKRKNGWD